MKKILERIKDIETSYETADYCIALSNSCLEYCYERKERLFKEREQIQGLSTENKDILARDQLLKRRINRVDMDIDTLNSFKSLVLDDLSKKVIKKEIIKNSMANVESDLVKVKELSEEEEQVAEGSVLKELTTNYRLIMCIVALLIMVFFVFKGVISLGWGILLAVLVLTQYQLSKPKNYKKSKDHSNKSQTASGFFTERYEQNKRKKEE